MEIKNILVTGGCGFIGSHFIHYCYRSLISPEESPLWTNWSVSAIWRIRQNPSGFDRVGCQIKTNLFQINTK